LRNIGCRAAQIQIERLRIPDSATASRIHLESRGQYVRVSHSMKNLVLMLVAAGFGYGVCWIQQLSPEPKTRQTADTSAPPPRVAAPKPKDDKLTREIGQPLIKAKTDKGHSFWVYSHRVVFVSSSGAMIGTTPVEQTNVPGQSYFLAPEDPATQGSPRREFLVTRDPDGSYQIRLLPSATGPIDRGRFSDAPGTAPGTSGLRGSALDQRPGR
jgi:hypothetical protein